MKALTLDLIAPAKKPSSFGVLLLTATLIAGFVLITEYRDLQDEEVLLEQERTAHERSARGLAAIAVSIDPATLQKIESANAIIDQLALPWDHLFSAVETAAADSVVLTGIAPDARTGVVQISGDAVSENAMIDYVRRLEEQTVFSGVYLLNHQRVPRNGTHPYRFTVTATWMRTATR